MTDQHDEADAWVAGRDMERERIFTRIKSNVMLDAMAYAMAQEYWKGTKFSWHNAPERTREVWREDAKAARNALLREINDVS